jgi:proline iminopeptidase
MAILYPDIEPYATHQIAVGQAHVLMVEECGNPKGLPVVFLHGGPGAHCKPFQRCFF